jgi:branched-subunit amino acid ABC-type transport system permease component
MPVAQALLNGVVSGLLIALPAIGLSLTYGVLNFPNFAIGAMITVGAYLAYFLNAQLGLALVIAASLASVGLALIAVVVAHLVYRPLKTDDPITLLIASAGVAFVLENLVRFIYGAEVRSFDQPVARPLLWQGLRLNHEQLVVAVVTVAAMVTVAIILKRTRLGRAMRALSDNAALAQVRGVDKARTVDWTWALAGVLTALAGVLIGMDGTVEPLIGSNYLITVFAAAIVGGIGNPLGAMAGGLIIGVVEELSTLALPTTYRQGVSFLMLVLVLFTRPQGLAGAARFKR